MATDPQLRELQIVFFEEAKQFLSDAEETLLTLEKQGFDIELVNKAFRLAHNFKGSSRSVGFTELGRLAHRYEDILSAIKGGTRELTPAIITALLKCNDKLKIEIEALQADENHQSQIDSDLAALDAAMGDSGGSHGAPPQKEESVDWEKGFAIFDEPAAPKTTAAPKIAPKVAKAPVAKATPAAAAVDEQLKIPASRLDQLLNIIGELVVNQTILDDCRSRSDTGSDMAVQAIGYMSKLISDIQNLSLSLRLVPIRPLFQKLRRTARDVASSLNKEVNLIDEGDYCELDKGVIDKIADPLNHMIRNAMDHGVDTKEERVKLGKSEVATVRLEAITQDDHVKIIVSDDGRGLNREKILAKAVKSGLVEEGAVLSDQQVYALIFAAGFSTKEQVTDVSGRGVGMEVVQTAVDELKGTIRIESELGKGTKFEISLPLSLSIISGMVIQADGQRYVVPVSQLVETIELGKYDIETVTGTGRALNLRGEVLPVYNLTEILSNKPQRNRAALTTNGKATPGAAPQSTIQPALVTQFRGKKVTFEVDEIVNQQKVVLKKLGKEFEGLPGIVAGAVLNNGEPGLVLSLDSLVS